MICSHEIDQDERVKLKSFYEWIKMIKIKYESKNYTQVKQYLDGIKRKIDEKTRYNVHEKYQIFDLYNIGLDTKLRRIKF
jgi:hypothetical protein